jgi:putative cell wall-binding protein
MEEGLKGLNVKRLAGANRFETNLKVLAEAGVPAGETVLVCTGSDFADCLSASAVGKPILLTYKRVMDGQGDFLKSLKNPKFCIVGGTSAVNKTVENFVSGYGQVKRLAGEHRYQTSVLVAQEFFKDPDKLVLAYARNYPDGLCGGALAYTVGAPLILTDSKYYSFGQDYAKDKGIFSGTALGGSGLISDEAVRKIFSMETDRLIYSK